MMFCHLLWPHPVHSTKQDCSSGAPDALRGLLYGVTAKGQGSLCEKFISGSQSSGLLFLPCPRPHFQSARSPTWFSSLHKGQESWRKPGVLCWPEGTVPLMLVLPSLPLPVGGEADAQRGLSLLSTNITTCRARCWALRGTHKHRGRCPRPQGVFLIKEMTQVYK